MSTNKKPKQMSDHITDLFIKWHKEQKEMGKALKKAGKNGYPDTQYAWGRINQLTLNMLELGELKLKAVLLEHPPTEKEIKAVLEKMSKDPNRKKARK